MGGGEFQALFEWLKANNDVLTTFTSIIAVGIATLAMLITIPMWLATRRQAILTRQAFEASHTPYVSIHVEEPTDMSQHRVLSFNMVLHNQSAALAHVIQWEIYATLTDLELKEHRLLHGFRGDRPNGTFAPGERKVVQLSFLDSRFPTTDLPFRLIGMLAYRGSGSSIYITDFEADRGNANGTWTIQECRMRRPEDILFTLGFKNY
jgi:hypothetical protein